MRASLVQFFCLSALRLAPALGTALETPSKLPESLPASMRRPLPNFRRDSHFGPSRAWILLRYAAIWPLEAAICATDALFKAYAARIDEVNLKGPALRAVLEVNPSALAQAKALDEKREVSGARSLLHGIPFLLEDNIATNASEGLYGWTHMLLCHAHIDSGLNTTAGSFALLRSIVPSDAGVVKRFRAAG